MTVTVVKNPKEHYCTVHIINEEYYYYEMKKEYLTLHYRQIPSKL